MIGDVEKARAVARIGRHGGKTPIAFTRLLTPLSGAMRQRCCRTKRRNGMTLRNHRTPDQLRAHAILDRVRAGTCRSDYLIAWALLTLGRRYDR